MVLVAVAGVQPLRRHSLLRLGEEHREAQAAELGAQTQTDVVESMNDGFGVGVFFVFAVPLVDIGNLRKTVISVPNGSRIHVFVVAFFFGDEMEIESLSFVSMTHIDFQKSETFFSDHDDPSEAVVLLVDDYHQMPLIEIFYFDRVRSRIHHCCFDDHVIDDDASACCVSQTGAAAGREEVTEWANADSVFDQIDVLRPRCKDPQSFCPLSMISAQGALSL